MIIKFAVFKPKDKPSNIFKDMYNAIDACFASINKNAFKGAETLRFTRVSEDELNLYLDTIIDDISIIKVYLVQFAINAKDYFGCKFRNLIASAITPTTIIGYDGYNSRMDDCDLLVLIPDICAPFMIKYKKDPIKDSKKFSISGTISLPNEVKTERLQYNRFYLIKNNDTIARYGMVLNFESSSLCCNIYDAWVIFMLYLTICLNDINIKTYSNIIAAVTHCAYCSYGITSITDKYSNELQIKLDTDDVKINIIIAIDEEE